MKEAQNGLKSIQYLFENKELYEILIENKEDAIFFVENSQIVDCNKAAVGLFGLTVRDEFIGKSPFDYSPELQPDGSLSKEKAQKLIAESFKNKTQQFIWQLIRSNGTLYETHVAMNSFKHENHSLLHISMTEISVDKNNVSNDFIICQSDKVENGCLDMTESDESDEKLELPLSLRQESIGHVWSFRDITNKKTAEQQLLLMAHTIKSINECISITDIADRILFVNPAFIKTYGYTEEELIGQNIKMVRPPGIDPNLISQLMNTSNSNTWQGEILNRRKDGTDFLISLSTSMVQNDSGEILGMVGVAVDISKQKQAELELRKSEQRLRNLIQTMPDGVYRSTPEGKFVEVNPAMVKILGYDSKEELMNIDIKTQLYFDPSDRESLILEEELEEMGIFRLKKKDGTGVWIEDHGWYVTDESGKTIFHEGISRDVTERKLAEMQLQKYSDDLKELNVTKDKFFSIIAHDLKSPFNSISGLSEILKNEAAELDKETIKQYAGIIYSTSLQTFRLLENLLDWARLQQSQIIFRPVFLLLKEIVDEVFELMIEKAVRKNIELVNFIPVHLIISADQDMLKTILRNLVSNALKFTSPKGKIEISAVMRSHEIEIVVKDNGTGIKLEDLDKLFKVDAIISERGTANESGTGLGLMLCKEFTEKHGGRIWVESEIGKGSTFIFTISQNNTSNH